MQLLLQLQQQQLLHRQHAYRCMVQPLSRKQTAGDFQAYSEVNATVTGTVTAGGMTLSAGMSVDAGTGYDFADDDTFDVRQTGTVSLDSVSVDMGSAGKITLDQNATHTLG